MSGVSSRLSPAVWAIFCSLRVKTGQCNLKDVNMHIELSPCSVRFSLALFLPSAFLPLLSSISDFLSFFLFSLFYLFLLFMYHHHRHLLLSLLQLMLVSPHWGHADHLVHNCIMSFVILKLHTRKSHHFFTRSISLLFSHVDKCSNICSRQMPIHGNLENEISRLS